MKQNVSPLLLLLLLSGILSFSAIGNHDLWPADEPRFAEVAREMMISGDYLVPRVNGMPYKEKPPLLFWSIAAASFPFGDVTEFSARFPSAVAGILTVLCTFLLAERLFGRRTAFWAGMILVTSQRFWWQSLTAQIDMLLTACLSAALLFFWLWHEERRRLWLFLFYAAITAGVYAKGPPALVFPLLLAFSFYWKNRPERRHLHLFAGLVVVILLIAAWLVPARMAVSGDVSGAAQSVVGSDLYNQIVGRFLSGGTKAQPPWYYLINLPLDWLPWSLFLPWTLPWIWKHRRDGEPMRLLLAWSVPAFIFFSICVGKRAIYLLPLAPALAIFFSRSILDLAESTRARWRRWTGGVWSALLLLLGAAPFIALMTTKYREHLNFSLLFLGLLGLSFGFYVLYRTVRGDVPHLHALMAFQFGALLFFTGLFILPAVDNMKSARAFCAPLKAATLQNANFTVYSLGFSREEYIFYARHFHVPITIPIPDSAASNEDNEADMATEIGRFVTEFTGKGPNFLIVQKKDWQRLLPFIPDAAALPVLRDQQVGRRHVLLIANGQEALRLAATGI